MGQHAENERRDRHPQRRQRQRRPVHRPHIRPGSVQSALEQDGDQGHRAKQLGYKRIIEIEESPQQHPQAHEHHQRRHPDPGGNLGRQGARQHQQPQ